VKRFFLSVAVTAILSGAPLTYAQTTSVQVGDPYTDTVNLWSEIASAISSLANDFAAIFNGRELATNTASAPSQPQSQTAAAASSIENPQEVTATTPPGNVGTAAPATTTVVNYITSNPVQRIIEDPLATGDYVTQPELAASLLSLSNALEQKFSAPTSSIPQYVAANGNGAVPYAAENNISSLSGVTITNANLTASEIPALDYLSLSGGTLSGTLSVPSLNASTTNYGVITATNSSTTNATSTNLFASLATFTTGIVNALSGTTLTYTAATTTDLAVYGSAQFGGTATSSFDSTGDLTVAGNTTLQNATSTNLFADSALSASAARFGATATSSFSAAGALTLANLASAVLGVNQSDQVVATTSIGTNLLTGSLGTLNGTSLPAGGSVTITAASSTLLSDANNWTGLQSFANASTTLGTVSTLWLPNVSANSLAYLNGNNQVAAAAVSYPLQFSGGSLSLAYGTTTVNAWSQLQTLQSGFVSQASSTVVGPLTLTGTLSAQGATFAAPLSLTSTTGTTTIASGQGFTVGGSQFVVQQGSGNVGVGTTTPANPFDLEATDSGSGLAAFQYPGLSSGASTFISVGKAAAANERAGLSYTYNTNSALQLIGLGFAGQGDDQLVITGNDNVGIGTTTPQTALDIFSNANAGSGNPYLSQTLIEGNSNNVGLNLINYQSGGRAWALVSGGSLSGDAPSSFGIVDQTSGGNTRFVINSSGNVGIGTTNPGATFDVAGNFQVNSSGNILSMNNFTFPTAVTGLAHRWVAGPGAGNGADAFNIVDATAGTGVVLSAGGTSWSSYSDQRLKTNIEPLTASSSLAAILQLNPVTFNWKSITAPTTTQMGFIAQQMQTVFPFFVSDIGTTTITNAGGSTTTIPDTLGINYTDLVVPLVAAVQDIANISSTFEQNLIAWLGNAQNGIGQFFAQVGNFQTVNASSTNSTTGNFQQVCISDGPNDPAPLCLTKTQLAALLSQTASAQTSESAISTASNISGSSVQNPTPTLPGSVTSATSSDQSKATDTSPQIQINGDNPAIVQVGATYQDLGATITGPTADLNLGIKTFLNGVALSPVQIDTSQAATDTISYVVTDQHGLTSTSTRTVIVEAPSLPAPVIVANLASSTAASSTTENTPTATQATTTSVATTTDATSTAQ
jgi:hypothetical protein